MRQDRKNLLHSTQDGGSMNPLPARIPDELVPEVFALAAQLYAQQTQGYTLDELMLVGAEARIPPEFIQQALEQIQAKRKQQQIQRFWLWGILAGTIALLGGGILLSLRQSPSTFNAPVMTNPVEGNQNTPLDWSNAQLKGTSLKGRDLKGANLSYADLRDADLSGANLENANFTGANLRDADLENANLSGANLRDANLREADLENANLSGADLSRADLSEAKLEGAILPNQKP